MSSKTMVLLSSLVLALLVSPDANAQSSRRGFSPEIQAELAALKEEPTVQKAQSAALQFFNIDPSSVTGMRNRASIKGLVPTLDARYRLNNSQLDSSTRNTLVNDENEDPLLFDDVSGTAHEIQVGLRWNLPELVFNAEVLDVSSLAILQEGVLKEVTRLYYTRRRLQIDLILNPPSDPGTEISKALRIEELESTLDAMTGNLFSRWRASRPATSANDRGVESRDMVASASRPGVRAAPAEVLRNETRPRRAAAEENAADDRDCFAACQAHQEHQAAPEWVREHAEGAGAAAYARCRQIRGGKESSVCMEKEVLACARSCESKR
jgi:hypothetical protein